MAYIMCFAFGLVVGAVYNRVIIGWKNRAAKAAHAAHEALREG